MPRDSLGKLVAGLDHYRAGRFSGSVPGRATSTRQVCPACWQVPDYAAHRAAYEKPWRDHGWLPDSWEPRRWIRETDSWPWERADYDYQRPEGCPTCGGGLVEIEGW